MAPTGDGRHHRAKLGPSDVGDVRRLVEAERLSRGEVADRYDCTPVTVGKFCKRHGIASPYAGPPSFFRHAPDPSPPHPSTTYTDAAGRTVTRLAPGWAKGVEPGRWARGYDTA